MFQRPSHSLLFVFFLYCSFSLQARLRLPEMLRDSMVLQRNTPLRIWGWADAGETIKVRFKNKSYTGITDKQGNWSVQLQASPAGGPFTLDIQDSKDHLKIRNVLIGDVWFCAGQSNMVHYLAIHQERYKKEIAEANYPEIRQFLVLTAPQLTGPQEDVGETHWKSARGKDVLRFSVIAYFFAKELYDRYHVPIGIINASVGGTPIEAWISSNGLTQFPELSATVDRNFDTAFVNGVNRKAAAFSKAFHENQPPDKGLSAPVPWYAPDYRPDNWRDLLVPGYWEDQGIKLNGVVWYRREIDVPEAMTGKPAKIALGRIVDADEVYVNGKPAGRTTYQYPRRRYDLPEGILHPGKNVLTIRVTNHFGKGGFVPDKPYYLAAGNDTIDLKGYWQTKIGTVFVSPSNPITGISVQNQPASLYNGMVAPFTSLALRGVVWYQGESNADDPQPYAALQRALIADWRKHWDRPEMPFLYVQLPNFMEVNYSPAESNWAALRQAQLNALDIPHTAMAVAIDLGEWNDIHPDNKKPVGDRLALAARHLAYGENDLVYSGPVCTSSQLAADSVILTFDQTGSGLTTKDGNDLDWFSVAGADRKFFWGQARIEDDKVILHSKRVPHPSFVRYAWADNPQGGLLYNKEGLPASPFEVRIENAVNERDSVAALSNADFRQMKQQLGISTPNRPGPSGDPNAPNAANSKESAVHPYALPDPLLTDKGKMVTTSSAWWDTRRPEIVEDFESEVYGRLPEHIPSVTWSISAVKDTTIGPYRVKQKSLTGHVDNSSYPGISVDIELQVVTPVAAKDKVPVVLEFGFLRWPFGPPPTRSMSVFSTDEPSWKEQVISRGWGYAIVVPGSIQADNGAGLKNGIIGLVNQGKARKPDDWGALRAWAWGAGRVADYFEKDPDVDSKRLAIEGLSRYGKAALVTMAFDDRFSLGFIGSSGAGGASLLRRNFGEQIENLASSGEYHWFAGNFIKYASVKTAGDLPVDAHELIALCAPRPVFISAGSPQYEGNWIDAKGMFLAAVNASPVYRLLGKKGMETTTFPPLGTSLSGGDLAFRQHAGGHSTGPNWSTWLAWASRYWD